MSKTTFRQFLGEPQFYNSEPRIIKWLVDNNITGYEINDDLTVDVKGDVCIITENFTELPVKFGVVSGSFSISGNKNLTTLLGCPYEVGMYFDCAYSQKLKNLIGAPKVVGTYFDCGSCHDLESLEGVAERIGGKATGHLDISRCFKITSLHDIHNQILEVNEIYAEGSLIKSNILGLIKIKNLMQFLTNEKSGVGLRQAAEIINNHLDARRDIFACQNDLSDAGLEAFAKL